MKKVFYFILCFYSNIVLVVAKISKNDIIPEWNNIIWNNSLEWTDLLNSIFGFFRESIFGLLSLIAIGVFFYIWARLVVARWNPEELEKTWKSLIYAVIGIVLVSVSWAIFRLVAGLDF